MARLATISTLAEDLALGQTTSRKLVEDCLARIEAMDGEGARTFISVDAQQARAVADSCDSLRKANVPTGPFSGIPISVKDLCDIEGQVTRSGSKALDDASPAKADAEAVSRLRRAGFILIGRTNMTEFAYSGLGLNPHYGTPLCVWDREAGRIPGGSSSGAAISVADGMAHAAIGSDTGGSCRIPAAFNGLAGFKPTARRVPLQGTIPLSTSLDSLGPIARSTDCCARIDAILSDQPLQLRTASLRGLRVMVPTTVALDGMQEKVAADFDAALSRLSAAGALIMEASFPEFSEASALLDKGGFTAAESFTYHRNLIQKKGEFYDPRVLMRIKRGSEQSATDYISLLKLRKSIIERTKRRMLDYDVLVMPTVPILPPLVNELANDADYTAINLLVLRNSTFINLIDGCAISLPIHEEGTAPVGLTVAGTGQTDARLLALAAAMEPVIR